MSNDPHSLIAEARAKLAELQAVADAALEHARARLTGGGTLGKQETKALARAASLARYVADCAHRAAWEPPRSRRRRGPPGAGFAFEAWRENQLDPKAAEHERHAAELLRSMPLASMPLTPAVTPWTDRVRNWLGLDGLQRKEPSNVRNDGSL